jgi:hypothetical protein
MLNLCESHCVNAIWSLNGPKGPHLFILVTFLCQKIFNPIAKDTSIFHLKSNGSHRLSYFPIPTPLVHTSHHHDQPIASDWFVTWKNTSNLLQWSIFDMETFWHLVWTNLTSYKFSLFSFFLFLCTISKSSVCLQIFCRVASI